jgi:hypothetical protein
MLAASGSGPTRARIASAVGLAKGMSASNQRDRFFVVHRHARESLADIFGSGERIRIAVRSFRVHIDQAHLHRGQGILKFPLAAVALVAKPLALVPQ